MFVSFGRINYWAGQMTRKGMEKGEETSRVGRGIVVEGQFTFFLACSSPDAAFSVRI